MEKDKLAALGVMWDGNDKLQMVINVLLGNQGHVESGCVGSQKFMSIGCIVQNRLKWRYAVIIGVVVGNAFQRGNLVIICHVFTVVCFFVFIQSASWLVELLFSEIDFVVIGAFVFLFVISVGWYMSSGAL